MTNRVLKTYNGDEAYVFFSYAHANSEKVLPIIEQLDKANYRLWYDNGIEAGANWVEVVASHLLNSKTVIFFISGEFLKSQNCIREVNYAVAERKQMYCIFLDDSKLPKDMAMQLSTTDKYPAADRDPKETAQNIIDYIGTEYLGDGISGYVAERKKKKSVNIWQVLSVIFALLFLGISIFTAGYFNNWWSSAGIHTDTIDNENGEIEITEFKDSVARNVLLKAYTGESLYLYGDYMLSDSEAIRYKDSKWLINDTEIEKGTFNDLDLIKDKTGLMYLAVVNQDIKDFSPLSNLNRLVFLDVSGNPVEDISFIKDLNDIQILKIVDTDIKDYSVLTELNNLKSIYITLDMYEEVSSVIDGSTVDIIVR